MAFTKEQQKFFAEEYLSRMYELAKIEDKKLREKFPEESKDSTVEWFKGGQNQFRQRRLGAMELFVSMNPDTRITWDADGTHHIHGFGDFRADCNCCLNEDSNLCKTCVYNEERNNVYNRRTDTFTDIVSHFKTKKNDGEIWDEEE